MFIFIYLQFENYSVCLLGYQQISRTICVLNIPLGKSLVNSQGCVGSLTPRARVNFPLKVIYGWL